MLKILFFGISDFNDEFIKSLSCFFSFLNQIVFPTSTIKESLLFILILIKLFFLLIRFRRHINFKTHNFFFMFAYLALVYN
jgi:hypothetical protein